MSQVRQTACQHCGQDIEGFSPYPRGKWRDRGNNRTCPSGERKGMYHAPTAADLADMRRPAEPNQPTEADRLRAEIARLNEVCYANQSTVDLYKRERDQARDALNACLLRDDIADDELGDMIRATLAGTVAAIEP